MMMIKKIAAAAALLVAAPAFAAIATQGNGELFLAVFDDVTKVSYIKDLGLYQNDFKSLFDGAGAGGTKIFSLAGDANWTTFANASVAANQKWAVVALDNTGGTAIGGVRLFTTSKNTAANLTNMAKWTGQQFTNGTGSTQLQTLFNTVNNTGSHGTIGVALDYTINGSSVNFDADAGNGYFGQPGSGEFFNGTATFSNANAVGATSNFYQLSRSSASNQSAFIAVDLFAVKNDAIKTTMKFTTTGAGPVLTVSAVPEPSSYAMLLAGLAGVGFVARRRKQA
jgi:hypothetical protein